jgi:6,7-dimethyl-8-ribityllumazine synthase
MSIRTLEGQLDARGLSFDLIVSRFNDFITGRLLEGAIDTLRRHGASDEDLQIVRVPGAWELPFAARRLAKVESPADAILCLGTVIRGSTDHYQYVAAEATKGIASVSMETGVPIILGVLTVDTIEQAIERAGTKMGNKGADAAMAAIEMASLFHTMDEQRDI